MPARLVCLSGLGDFLVTAPIIVVGRDRDCEVRLVSSRVSRRHCLLTLVGDEVHVRDLGSTNGIAINRKKADRGILRAGDELDIAHLRYRLSFEDSDRVRVVDEALAAERATGPTLQTIPDLGVGDDPSDDHDRGLEDENFVDLLRKAGQNEADG